MLYKLQECIMVQRVKQLKIVSNFQHIDIGWTDKDVQTSSLVLYNLKECIMVSEGIEIWIFSIHSKIFLFYLVKDCRAVNKLVNANPKCCWKLPNLYFTLFFTMLSFSHKDPMHTTLWCILVIFIPICYLKLNFDIFFIMKKMF